MTQPLPRPTGPGRSTAVAGSAAFLLLGWSVLLVPSVIREVQRTYGIDDAGMGLAYFVNAVFYVAGTLATGLLAGRVPRRLLLAAGPALVAAGLVTMAATATWALFLAGFVVLGLGAGLIDAGANALYMDLFAGRAAPLNGLHLFFALGALAVPLVVGATVGRGIAWQAILLVTAAAAVPVVIALATRRMPATHPRGPSGPAAPVASGGRPWMPAPLALLALAIGCYVAMELGVSSWLVRYLDDAPLELATLALSLFWASLAVSRLASAFVADRLGPVRFAAGFAVAGGLAILVALAAPSLPVAIAAFAVAGFAAGPVYPVIMAIGGTLHPGRASMVSSVLASAAIVGSLVYPPLMGVVSDTAGLGVSMLGAALFLFGCAAAIVAAVRIAGRSPAAVGA